MMQARFEHAVVALKLEDVAVLLRVILQPWPRHVAALVGALSPGFAHRVAPLFAVLKFA
jgi:hypothetical protein